MKPMNFFLEVAYPLCVVCVEIDGVAYIIPYRARPYCCLLEQDVNKITCSLSLFQLSVLFKLILNLASIGDKSTNLRIMLTNKLKQQPWLYEEITVELILLAPQGGNLSNPLREMNAWQIPPGPTLYIAIQMSTSPSPYSPFLFDVSCYSDYMSSTGTLILFSPIVCRGKTSVISGWFARYRIRHQEEARRSRPLCQR